MLRKMRVLFLGLSVITPRLENLGKSVNMFSHYIPYICRYRFCFVENWGNFNWGIALRGVFTATNKGEHVKHKDHNNNLPVQWNPSQMHLMNPLTLIQRSACRAPASPGPPAAPQGHRDASGSSWYKLIWGSYRQCIISFVFFCSAIYAV